MGEIITFFSYKGGVGRTMALANVAVVLSQWGYNVLMVDWDLEAPGLENFFRSHLDSDKAAHAKGILDSLDSSLDASSNHGQPQWKDLVLPVSLPGAQGALHLLISGNRDGDYFQRVRNLDLQLFYTEHNGGVFIESLRDEWKREYDFILLDSRTGITDIGGICTIQLPDVIVLLFTATEQAFGGAIEVVKKAALARQKLPFERLQVPVVPIPSRFDTQREFKLSQEWLRRFSEGLSDVFSAWLPTSVDKLEFLELTKLPYISYFSFGEKLPVLEQGTNDPAGLGYAYETLAGLLANRLERVDLLLEDRAAFLRAAGVPFDAFLSYNSKDKREVRALAEKLRDRGLRVWFDEWELAPGRRWKEAIEVALRSARSVVVFVGPSGVGPWQDDLLALVIERGTPVIPVLLPKAPREPELPLLLQAFNWVDLRSDLDEASLDRLEWGITGVKPSANGATLVRNGHEK